MDDTEGGTSADHGRDHVRRLGQLPEGAETPEASPEELALGRAAQNAHEALTSTSTSVTAAVRREYVRRFQVAWNAAHRTPALAVDGQYGTHTRAALAAALGEPVSIMPAVRTPSAPTPAPAPEPDEGLPVWLGPAVALARWTVNARASDSTAAAKLRALRTHAAWISERTQAPIAGVEIGQVPSAPDDSSVASWAHRAWERAQREGASARRQLATHAEGIIASAERALVDVRRQLDRETDAAVRSALTALEATLTAILRPVSRGIATAVRPVGTGLVIVGIAAGVLYFSGRRRAA